MRAVRRFTVRARLPHELSPLVDLVNNLRWSWHVATLDLFAEIDPEVWAQKPGDPVHLLGGVSAGRLAQLAADPAFVAKVDAAAADLQAYLDQPRWYQSLPTTDVPTTIAYFSMEYGITEVLPNYSGGLGILAGDHLKAASDLGVPIVGLGLLYKHGYFVQSLSADGWQQERYPSFDPHGLPITQLTDAEGVPVKVDIQLPGHRTLHAQVWKAQVGRVPLLLLDSDIADNDDAGRGVTDRLYGGSPEHRLAQEMLLGIGGTRAARAYARATGTPQPEVFHCNEGHAGFLGVERIREYVEHGLDVDAALLATRAGTVFTTHTPVPAGIDRFDVDLVRSHFSDVPGVPVDRILALGAEEDPHKFNMAHMGLRLGQRANGVAKLHGVVSRGMFADLWPGFDTDEVPIGSVTNGVHAPTWVAREIISIAEDQIGAGQIDSRITTEAKGWASIAAVPDPLVWGVRNTLRANLVGEVRRRVRASWLERGATAAELGWTDSIFDPDVLTIGFARRVPSYKRLTLILRDPDRLKALLLDPERPIQLVIAGKSHPADDGGKRLVQEMVQWADAEDVRHRIAFLPDYDIGMAKHLYTGCDVWLNNPLRPLEACGTSGMKAALNGCLNLSIRDGWWDEMYDGENGWAIPTADGVDDPHRRDDIESAALYDLIENSVRVRYYDHRDADAVPTRWVAMVRHTLASLGPQVLASRMLRDYVLGYYGPAARSVRATLADDLSTVRQLSSWLNGVKQAWPGVRVLHTESLGMGDSPELGQQVLIRAGVDLGGLPASALRVQAVFGRVDEHDTITDGAVTTLEPAGDADGAALFEGTISLARTGSFGYGVRVVPSSPLLAGDAETGLVAVAAPAAPPTETIHAR